MWQFLKEYISAPDTIGAIAPSSRHLAAAMTASIQSWTMPAALSLLEEA